MSDVFEHFTREKIAASNEAEQSAYLMVLCLLSPSLDDPKDVREDFRKKIIDAFGILRACGVTAHHTEPAILLLAADKGDPAFVRALIDDIPDVAPLCDRMRTVGRLCARTDIPADIIKTLMDNGVDPDQRYEDISLHPIEIAIANGQREKLEHLLAAGANPDVKGGAPLKQALYKQSVPTVSILLKHGARTDIHCHVYNATAAEYAQSACRDAIALIGGINAARAYAPLLPAAFPHDCPSTSFAALDRTGGNYYTMAARAGRLQNLLARHDAENTPLDPAALLVRDKSGWHALDIMIDRKTTDQLFDTAYWSKRLAELDAFLAAMPPRIRDAVPLDDFYAETVRIGRNEAAAAQNRMNQSHLSGFGRAGLKPRP